MLKELKPSFKDKKVLVTGGTGLIGRAVSRLLLEIGAQVRVVSLDKDKTRSTLSLSLRE